RRLIASALQIATTLGILIFLFHDSAKRAQMAEALGRANWALAPCWRFRLWCCRNPGRDSMAASSPHSGLPAPLAASNVDFLYRGLFYALYSWSHRWRCDADLLSRKS